MYIIYYYIILHYIISYHINMCIYIYIYTHIHPYIHTPGRPPGLQGSARRGGEIVGQCRRPGAAALSLLCTITITTTIINNSIVITIIIVGARAIKSHEFLPGRPRRCPRGDVLMRRRRREYAEDKGVRRVVDK